jgi:hypothetical protein
MGSIKGCQEGYKDWAGSEEQVEGYLQYRCSEESFPSLMSGEEMGNILGVH